MKSKTTVRRSQEQRSDDSRKRIIDAAARSIAELGYRGTTMASIAKIGGFSVGAIQHQFGDKAEVLFAVVEEGLVARAAAFSLAPIVGVAIRERVAQFVRRMWREGYGGPEYATAIEILIAMRKDPEFMDRSNRYFGRVFKFIDRIWMGVFWDIGANREQHLSALGLTFNALNGMALQQLIGSLEDDAIDSSLNTITGAVTGILAGED